MTNTIHELERYGRAIDGYVAPITLDELRTRTTEGPMPVRRTRRSPAWVTAVAVAMFVLVVVGGLSFLLGGSEGVVEPMVAEEPTTPASLDLAVGLTADSFSWTRHDLAGYVTYPTAWHGGYVALVDDQVASSSDGVRWQPWPNQPPIDDRSLMRGLVVDGGRVVVISDLNANGTYPPTLPALSAFASNGEGTWQRLDIDHPTTTANQGWNSFLSTNGDQFIVTAGSGAWTLDGNHLTAMESGAKLVLTAGGMRQTVERAWVDSDITLPDTRHTSGFGERAGRFVAFASVPFDGVHTWTSTEGHLWQNLPPVSIPWDADVCREWIDANASSFPEVVVPAAKDYAYAECDDSWRTNPVVPSVVATGPLGWFATGAPATFEAPTFLWFSPDGLTWQVIDSIDRLVYTPQDWTSTPPIVLVEANRVLIYGSSMVTDSDTTSSGTSRWPPTRLNVWIGEPSK